MLKRQLMCKIEFICVKMKDERVEDVEL